MLDVQLHDFIARALAGILHHEADLDGAGARRSGKFWRSDLEVFISKRRVAQAITKWIQRSPAKVHVSPAVTNVVVHHRRQLLERFGPRLDQTTSRVVIAENNGRQCT